MADIHPFLANPGWYPKLGAYSLFTTFVAIPDEAKCYLGYANRENFENAADINARMVELLRRPLEAFQGYVFVTTDHCAPTDTRRFVERHGAVHTASQAWHILCASEKVRRSAAAGQVHTVCIRQYHLMNVPREFRLFIRNGELVAMSQYHLVRHFRRLDGVRERYWAMAAKFVKLIGWMLPLEELVMDIYITKADQVRIVDLNPWGAPTDPLLLRSWDRDWSKPAGIVLMAPPAKLSGNVDVSF